MSQEAADQQRRNIQEFLQVLPLTMAIAGLPDAPSGSYFNEGQLEARSTAIRNAYKQARQLLRDIAKS
jgi:hypothetical protein